MTAHGAFLPYRDRTGNARFGVDTGSSLCALPSQIEQFKVNSRRLRPPQPSFMNASAHGHVCDLVGSTGIASKLDAEDRAPPGSCCDSLGQTGQTPCRAHARKSRPSKARAASASSSIDRRRSSSPGNPRRFPSGARRQIHSRSPRLASFRDSPARPTHHRAHGRGPPFPSDDRQATKKTAADARRRQDHSAPRTSAVRSPLSLRSRPPNTVKPVDVARLAAAPSIQTSGARNGVEASTTLVQNQIAIFVLPRRHPRRVRRPSPELLLRFMKLSSAGLAARIAPSENGSSSGGAV